MPLSALSFRRLRFIECLLLLIFSPLCRLMPLLADARCFIVDHMRRCCLSPIDTRYAERLLRRRALMLLGLGFTTPFEPLYYSHIISLRCHHARLLLAPLRCRRQMRIIYTLNTLYYDARCHYCSSLIVTPDDAIGFAAIPSFSV